jgi:hypothetical protein
VVLVAVAGAVAIEGWRHFSQPESGSDAVGYVDGHPTFAPPKDRVRLHTGGDRARTTAAATTDDEAQAVFPDTDPARAARQNQVTNVEDEHLERVVLQPGTLRTAPPRPPRASVDPEPAVPDDPRDFELVGR